MIFPAFLSCWQTDRSKAVADGAVSFYLDHYVSVRMSKFSYGTECSRPLDLTDPEHVKRAQFSSLALSGLLCFSPAYSEILPKVRALALFLAFWMTDLFWLKGTQVSETKQFYRKFFREFSSMEDLDTIEMEIVQYKGDLIRPQWMDIEPGKSTDQKVSERC